MTTAMASNAGIAPTRTTALEDTGDQRLVLSDLLNRVLDRGLVITGSVTLAVADVDLVQLDLRLMLSAVETALHRREGDSHER